MDAAKVRAYYEANTAGFLRFGHSGEVGAIHRAVWTPGVRTRAEALRTCERRVLDASDGGVKRVLDLGCGVGSSMAFIAEETTASGVGVSISPLQVRLATQRFVEMAVEDRMCCVEADFSDLPDSLGSFDLAYAIESFVHAASPSSFFEQAAKVVSSKGMLVIVDDFCDQRVEVGRISSREARWIREFKSGWHAESLVSVARARELGNASGFEFISSEDLTDFVELRRPRDLLITALVRVGRRLPISHPGWLNLLGGNALQMALTRRLMTYQVLVFRRR